MTWVSRDKQFKVEDGKLYRRVNYRSQEMWVDLTGGLTGLEEIMLKLLVEATE